MRIIVLDGHTLNPGDNPWTELKSLGSLLVHERTSSSQIIERAKEAEIILTNKTPLDASTLEQLPNLKFVSVLATGYNVVDVVAAAQRNIPVSNVPTYGTQSVAQHAFALLLELCHHVGRHHQSVQNGDWANASDWCYWKMPLIELDGKILGIIGAGRIGQAVARMGRAFGMKIWITSNRSKSSPPDGEWSVKTIEEIFRGADVVSLHCPQTKENAGFVNRTLLGTMKPSAFLINTARGGLIVEQDLAEALAKGKLAGAGLDVVSAEPIRPDNPLLSAKNCLLTPHMAWSSLPARRRLMKVTVENVRGFLQGNVLNRVN